MWEENFRNIILTRAKAYFYDDRVEVTSVSRDEVNAIVHGSKDYDVCITFKDFILNEMTCTCPYAEKDKCKHMAATMYQIDYLITIDLAQNILKNLDNIDDKVIRGFVKEIIKTDPAMPHRFKEYLHKLKIS